MSSAGGITELSVSSSNLFTRRISSYDVHNKISSYDVPLAAAPGSPACPDHTEKAALFELLDVKENIGLELTESFAMAPAAAVSGWYFGHPDAKYFNTGKISADQVESLAGRKGMTVTELERWLTPILND